MYKFILNNFSLEKRENRILIVATVALLVLLIVRGYQNFVIFKPFYWYHFTQTDQERLNAPTRIRDGITDQELIPRPQYAPGLYAMYEARCGDKILELRGSNPKFEIYRDVRLCNSAALTGHKFEIARNEFRQFIDSQYANYYKDIIFVFIENFFILLVFLLIFKSSSNLLKWIIRGR